MYDFVILGLLMYRDLTGYELKQFAEHTIGNFSVLSFGSIYPILAKLQKNGFIAMREESETGRLKKIYKIQEEGKTKFLSWLEEPIEFVRGQQKELLRIFFFSFLTEEKRHELLTDFSERINKELLRIDNIIKKEGKDLDYFHFATSIYGKNYYEMISAWCEALIDGNDLGRGLVK